MSVAPWGAILYGRRALEGLREIGVIWRGEVTRALRSGRVIVLLVLFALFTGLSLSIIGWFAHQATSQAEKQAIDANVDPERAQEALTETKQKFVSYFFADQDEALGEALLAMPLVLLIVFKLSVRFVPFFIALMGFDQISGEIGPRSIRYLVVRSRRSSILLGKFLAQATVLALLMAASVGMMVAVARVGNDTFGLGVAALTFVKLWAAAMVLSVAYLALTSLCSALFRQAPLSLIFNVIALFAVWFVALVGEAYRLPGDEVAAQSMDSFKSESPLAYARYLSVFHYASGLLHPHWQKFGAAGLAHLGFALCFLGLGYAALRRRDL